MLAEIEDFISRTPFTERVRELQRQALECRNACERAVHDATSEEAYAALVKRVTALLAEAEHVAGHARGPHSENIRIV
jgi:hypothetical protein